MAVLQLHSQCQCAAKPPEDESTAMARVDWDPAKHVLAYNPLCMTANSNLQALHFTCQRTCCMALHLHRLVAFACLMGDKDSVHKCAYFPPVESDCASSEAPASSTYLMVVHTAYRQQQSSAQWPQLCEALSKRNRLQLPIY